MNFKKHSTEQVFSSLVGVWTLLEEYEEDSPLFDSACLILMELQNEFLFRVGEYYTLSFPFKGKILTFSNKE